MVIFSTHNPHTHAHLECQMNQHREEDHLGGITQTMEAVGVMYFYNMMHLNANFLLLQYDAFGQPRTLKCFVPLLKSSTWDKLINTT